MLDARLFVVTRDNERNGRRLGCGHAPRFRTSVLRKCALAAFTKLLRKVSADRENRHKASNGGQFAHDPVEARLPLETDARAIGERNCTVLDFGVVGKTTEITKDSGIGFGAAKAEAGSDGE